MELVHHEPIRIAHLRGHDEREVDRHHHPRWT